jgi:MYXO-CTERM domain-containing protein
VPPIQTIVSSAALARATSGTIDIGAFELGGTTQTVDAGTNEPPPVEDAGVQYDDAGNPIIPGAGPPPGTGPSSGENAGCACHTTPARSGGAVAGLVLFGLLAWRRRSTRL